MIVAQRFRPRFWRRLKDRLKTLNGDAQNIWEDAWLDRCRQRIGEPYLRLVEDGGKLNGRRFDAVNPEEFPMVDASGNLYTELTPLQRLEVALNQGADPNHAFGLPLEGLTKGGRRRYELVLNAEFPGACELVRARWADAAQHRAGTSEAAGSRGVDPLYPALPRHWKEARTPLDWCLLLGDDEAIERLGLIHKTLSEQDPSLRRRDTDVAIHQASVLMPATSAAEAPSPSHEARWHRTARRLDALTTALTATGMGGQDDPDVPAVARGGDFRAIVDSADIDVLDEEGRHVFHALQEGLGGPVREGAEQAFWTARYAIGGRALPLLLEATPGQAVLPRPDRHG